MTTTGGPAFPVVVDMGLTVDGSKGMTLRDYFAAKASEEDIEFWRPTGRMAITASSITGRPLEVPELRTREQARYAFADAMLKARDSK
jgi:hypothetical protein